MFVDRSKSSVWLLALLLLIPGCGGGGGGSGTALPEASPTVELTRVEFVDPSGQTVPRPLSGPGETSLIQRIRLDFSGVIDIDSLDTNAIFIRERLTQFKAEIDYAVRKQGRRLLITPILPMKEAILEGVDWIVDSGLRPGVEYELVIAIESKEALGNLSGIRREVRERFGYVGGDLVIAFETTDQPEGFWTGIEKRPPTLVEFRPEDGEADMPLHLFSDKNFEPYLVRFDGPIDPAADNIGPGRFRLLDVDEGQDVVVRTWIESSTLSECVLRIEPVGLLRDGGTFALMMPQDLRGLAGGSGPSNGFEILSTFQTLSLEEKSRDRIVERFTTRELAETSLEEFDVGHMPADWDAFDSNSLEAALDFPGHGELGRFIPFPDENINVIVLNTDHQEFPLVDGSTPDARSGTVVEGGVFNFSEIRIPQGMTIRGEGSNPLVLTATVEMTVRGDIDVAGLDGEFEYTKDQSLVPLRGGLGGPGGGRGGDGHPARYDGAFQLVSPRDGDPGSGGYQSPFLGGRPGIGGVLSDDRGLNCNNGVGASRGGAGGGGSFLRVGDPGKDGKGDEHVTSAEKFDENGMQIFVPLPDSIAYGGGPGDAVFRDGNPLNDFIGRRGERRNLIAGQGGGGGGSRLDSYWCYEKFPGLPPTVVDARGAGGGGGGGALMLLSMGDIRFGPNGHIFAYGGEGGGGEANAKSSRGGGGGGGAGGLVRVMTAANLILEVSGNNRFEIEAEGGEGGGAPAQGKGGLGSPGVVQLQVPAENTYDPNDVDVTPPESLVPIELAPSELVSESVGQSRWIDLGRGVFRAEGGPNFDFQGIDEDGYVLTEDGFLPDPSGSDIRVDSLPVIDPTNGRIIIPGKKDFIPENATVRLEFQAGQPLATDPGRVDPNNLTEWSPTIDVADGHQFIRFRVTMDIAVDGHALSPELPRVAVRLVRVGFDF